MIVWNTDMDQAPRDGTEILVWFDHAADPYHDPDEPGTLTNYAAWAEGGDFMDGVGVCVAKWFTQYWESVDEYGAGYWMPAAWFALENDDFVRVCNPLAWSEINPAFKKSVQP